MLKSNEYKAYGSIRKTKVAGACGVILALAMLGMAFNGTVSADEVSTAKPVAVEKKTEVEVPISHDKLDKAVAEAKNAGVKVEVGAVQDKGVATSETVAEKQKEIEADYAKQEKDVKTVTDDYSSKVDKTTKEREVIEKENKAKQEAYDKAVTDHKAEVNRIEAENKAILADNAKKEADTKAENKAILADNAKKEATYNKNVADQKAYNEKVEKDNADLKADYDKKQAKYESDLAEYNKKKAELAKKGVKAEKPHIKVYGDYDNSKRGSVGYYSNLTASFEGIDGLTAVKDYIGLHSDTTISGSRAGLLGKNPEYFAEIVNPKAGDSFTLHNVAESKDGKKISAKFTFNSAEAYFVKDGKPLSDTRIYVRKDNGSGSINFVYGNLIQFDTKVDLFYEKTNKPAVTAIASTFNDIDWGQELRFTYQDGSEGIVLNPNGSDVKKITRGGKEYFKGEHKSASGKYYENVGDESDIPLGSLLSVGYGSSFNFAYHIGAGVASEEEIESKRAEVIRQNGGKNLADKDIFYQDGWAVGLFGKASSTVPITIPLDPPRKPELKQKDTKEIPKPKLEKPKEFVPRPTLPTPPAPTPPEKKKIPEMPLVPTVKVNYSRLRVKPLTPKPKKAIVDTFGHNIDGANTFDKNVKFRLTTDYKPYSTFTADSKTYGKTWAMADDVQDGAYKVDDSKITMKDSTGKDVKALFNMYHVLSEKQRTKEIQSILKEAGLNPKGEFYLWVAKDSASFYKNYVKPVKNITIELPARLLVEKGKIVKNDFHQIDFGNAFVSNLVTLQVPDLKPEKHAVDQKDDKKIRDGQEIKIGEYLRYFLDGVTVPAKHDTLYQYDGIDKLDVKHDRYTGNWKGIIRGTEYVAEKELTLPYDVVLSNGKVVKAGDKIAKGSAYAFQFEFDQSTNSNFIKKIVKVTWNEKEGKWAYTIDKDFLNSLGVKGTFDADFYIEVERIAAGKVENTFINTVNLQEMTAKVTTTTPEPPKPEPKEPHKPQASLPNTGTAASMLPVVGMILGLLSLAGLRKYKK
ncbi:LPXTG-motif cell wall anchor domain protein [Streptococcus mitis]|uniref:LPXTG-motif cell wall anchor domain protein n=3 Tax=Streptococcus mitis group TaxID=3409772 RepID=A0A081PUJ8_STRMT|nr:SspB-related isopeptide-forming adhesin [Streptococcus mitis]KEQ34371.1 LPXTG-motif cell wall anchor domain protein [Streptococcus mitis]